MYNPQYKGKDYIHPKGGNCSYLTPQQLKHIKALYAGEVSFVDKWIGIFLEKEKELGLLENTLLIFLSDHGHPLGEHGIILKRPSNLYPELIHISLLIRHPQGPKGMRIKGFVQTPDLFPTILNLLEIKQP